MYLLEYVGNLPLAERNNPLKIARHLSEIVHDANGYGVLKGNRVSTLLTPCVEQEALTVINQVNQVD